MSTIAAFLMAITGSIAARVMVSLGLGVISYAAVSTIIDRITDAATASLNGATGDVLAIANLGGLGEGMSILIAGMTARASLSAIKRIGIVP